MRKKVQPKHLFERNMSANQPMTARQVAALVRPEAVCLDLQARTQTPALREVAALLGANPAVPDLAAFLGEILAREASGNTALGHGIAMPHARTDLCREIVIAVGRSAGGIDYGAADGQPVRLVFLIGTPMPQVTEYLRVVGALARLLAREPVRQRLLAADNAMSFIAALAEAGIPPRTL